MARITDVERGARMAASIAHDHIIQPDLYDLGLGDTFWHQIQRAAADQLAECAAYHAASIPTGDAWS